MQHCLVLTATSSRCKNFRSTFVIIGEQGWVSLLNFVCMRCHDITDIGRGCGTSDYGSECAQLQGPLGKATWVDIWEYGVEKSSCQCWKSPDWGWVCGVCVWYEHSYWVEVEMFMCTGMFLLKTAYGYGKRMFMRRLGIVQFIHTSSMYHVDHVNNGRFRVVPRVPWNPPLG